jgi:hypothetical protein
MNLVKRKKYDLDRVVHSQSETRDRRWGLASVVSVRSTVPREVKVEIFVARAVGFAIRASVPYFLLLRQKHSYEVYNGEKIPINENA